MCVLGEGVRVMHVGGCVGVVCVGVVVVCVYVCVCVCVGTTSGFKVGGCDDHDHDHRTLGGHICLQYGRIGCARKSEVFSMVS